MSSGLIVDKPRCGNCGATDMEILSGDRNYEFFANCKCGAIGMKKREIEAVSETPNKNEEKYQCHESKADVVSALKRLVDLKDHKDTHGKSDWYKNNQKQAWEQAKAALETMVSPNGKKS